MFGDNRILGMAVFADYLSLNMQCVGSALNVPLGYVQSEREVFGQQNDVGLMPILRR